MTCRIFPAYASLTCPPTWGEKWQQDLSSIRMSQPFLSHSGKPDFFHSTLADPRQLLLSEPQALGWRFLSNPSPVLVKEKSTYIDWHVSLSKAVETVVQPIPVLLPLVNGYSSSVPSRYAETEQFSRLTSPLVND